ncbi:MAG: FecR domain-containing protein [Thiobacillaceae bacterium]
MTGLRRYALMLGLLVWAWSVLAEGVGHITLRLGEAWVLGAAGERRPAQVDAPLYAGETIETAASGHVHIRFVDGGLVSVRPNSRLIIAAYADPAVGGAVRFKLDQGSARSVTGRYGEKDRGRFRLNTPIAAIGINGTDFVVESRPEATRVAVFSGSIVAAPFDEGCRPEALGPCGGERAVRLSAEAGDWLVEIRPQDGKPLLLPRGDFARRRGDAVELVKAAAPEVTEIVTQTQALPSTPAVPPTLVWARWAHAAPWPEDHLGTTAGVPADYERVAENARYALYRLPQTEPLPGSGQVSLTLAGGQAHLQRPGEVLPAAVTGGRLDLDFAARRFATTLGLAAAPTGPVELNARGSIQPDGRFGLIEIGTRLHGAWGTGGSGPAAGYVFEHNTPQGQFNGITSWR